MILANSLNLGDFKVTNTNLEAYLFDFLLTCATWLREEPFLRNDVLQMSI